MNVMAPEDLPQYEQPAPDNPMLEKALQSNVIRLAGLLGWQCYHTYNSQRSQPGFPDLVLVRNGVLIFAELKSDNGRVSPEQDKWLLNLAKCNCHVFVWRPIDWIDGTIEEHLR